MYFLLSIVLGLIPEVLYFTLFLIYTKNLKEKKVKLFLLIAIAYLINISLCEYNVIYNVIFVGLVYIILKMLYKKKTQIIDIFLIMFACCYLTLLSCLVFFAKDSTSYYICYSINRILLFVPFIFRNNFNNLYRKYYSLWNRNYEHKKPIKSITIRNISLILINCIIFIINIICIYMLNLVTK